MILNLTGCRSGRLMLTADKPLRVKMRKFDLEDVYYDPGDPLAIMNLCPQSMAMLFKRDLQPFETARVRLKGEIISDVNELEPLDWANIREELSSLQRHYI